MENVDTRYAAFFGEINQLIEEAERQYGVGNLTFTEYIIERLQYSISVCSELLENMRGVLHLENYSESLRDLTDCLKIICKKWEEYEEILDSFAERPCTAYQSAPSISVTGSGRPRFNISKQQLEYLCSLSFKWNEIAILLGVSRMTIYR